VLFFVEPLLVFEAFVLATTELALGAAVDECFFVEAAFVDEAAGIDEAPEFDDAEPLCAVFEPLALRLREALLDALPDALLGADVADGVALAEAGTEPPADCAASAVARYASHFETDVGLGRMYVPLKYIAGEGVSASAPKTTGEHAPGEPGTTPSGRMRDGSGAYVPASTLPRVSLPMKKRRIISGGAHTHQRPREATFRR
jgi:hypothetical protein